MTAQPAGPAPVPDTGSYEVIHLGGQAAVVVVPVAGFLRLRALERLASAQELVLYEISGDGVSIGHIARGTASG